MIKASFRLILATLAATAALTACTKEPTPGATDQTPASPQAEGLRTIAVSFAPQTKTSWTSTSDGDIQPKFDNKDSILLVSWPKDSDPIKDTCIVSVDDKGIATISTDLAGDLMALYPAKHARIVGQSGKYGLPVPSVQTGKFADANLCGTQIKDGEQSATFQNGTPLFIITPPEGATRLTIKSLKQIGSDGQRTGSRYAISQNEEGDTQYTISIPNGPDEDGNYYVAVAETNGHLKLSDLSFEVEYETSGTGAIKGITTSAIAAVAGGAVNTEAYEKYNTVAPRTAYTIDGNNWHDYVEVGDRKWATGNVGEYGDFYMWGTSVVAYEAHPTQRDDMVVLVEINPYGEDIYKNTWEKAAGYGWNNTPFTKGVFNPDSGNEVFFKYTASVDTLAYNGVSDGKTILDLEDDAAYINWGGAWRMPTSAELEAIKTREDFICAGVLDDNVNTDPYTVSLDASHGYYWSSSLDTDHPEKAKCFVIQSGFDGSITSEPRYYGCNVRAIIDEPAAYNQEDAPQD